jgi:hypothetical protein
MVSSTAAGDYIVLQHQINGSLHTENNAQYIAAANVQVFTWVESRYIPPADGNYTFVMTGRRSSAATGTVSVINTGNNPLWLMIEDLGPISRVGVSFPAGQPMATALGNAIGVVAVGDTTNNLVTLTTSPGIALSTVISFTPQVGRRYKVKYQVRAINCSDNASGYVNLAIDGTVAPLVDSWFSGTTTYNGRVFDWVFVGDGVTHTYQLFGVRQNGTIDFHNQSSAGNCYFFIEDIGPTTSPPLPVTPTPTPWIKVTAFQNGWVNYDASGTAWAHAAYRKVGDEVAIRGLVASGPAGSAVFTLPAGYRPPYGLIFACDCANSTHVRIDANANGQIFVQSPMSGGNTGYLSLANIRFSVTG